MKVRASSILAIILLLAAALALGYYRLPVTAERSAQLMGTTVRIKLSAPRASYLAGLALAEIRRLEHLFRPVQLSSPDTKAVLKIAEKVRRASHGAFNVRFRGSTIDLGGIGKGYAVEAARRLLLNRGVKSAIIDMHSSIAVIGNGWRIAIVDPRVDKSIAGIAVLNDGDALSTSGQYEQPGHIIDPRTGKPADRCLSVTVVAKDAALADALSTAVFVLGPRDGLRLLKRYGAGAFIIGKNGKTYDNLGVKLR